MKGSTLRAPAALAAVVASLFACLGLASAAQAATVNVSEDGKTVLIQGGAEPNDIWIDKVYSPGHRVIAVTDTGTKDTINVAGRGCTPVPRYQDQVECEVASGAMIDLVMDLGAGDDETNLDTVPSTREVIFAGPGKDTIEGSANGDSINGGPGNDRLIGAGSGDGIDGGEGNDKIIQHGVVDSEVDGDGILIGGPGNDKITGGGGDDWIDAGSGRDKVLPGPGTNSVFTRDGEVDVIKCWTRWASVNKLTIDLASPRDKTRNCNAING